MQIIFSWFCLICLLLVYAHKDRGVYDTENEFVYNLFMHKKSKGYKHMYDRYIEPGRSDKMIQEMESIRKTCF